ncbi:MAG: nitroreductase family protein [Thermomicrobiales bacterium]|nr:nitroreductase family protein [Thermomicrobiales bacterium]
MPVLPLTLDELLTTTRAVRKRLDFARPVERAVLEECLTIAQQAPTGSNRQHWQFIVVTDPDKRAALADCYRRGWARYRDSPGYAGRAPQADAARAATQSRVAASAAYLADHMHEAPVLVVPCIRGRTDGAPAAAQAAAWGSILPAVWSFMLAARARGLGTVWTTLHLSFEEEAASVLGIPYAEVMQAALIPVAYTRGVQFQPGPREPLDTFVRWETW